MTHPIGMSHQILQLASKTQQQKLPLRLPVCNPDLKKFAVRTLSE